jgi:16S rRNA processing protein RimM
VTAPPRDPRDPRDPAPKADGEPAPRVEVAYVSRAHGIRGEILAVPIVDGSTTLADAEAIWLAGRRYDVERARPTPDGFLLALAGVTDRDVAATLRGKTIEVERAQLELGEDEVLLADLVGCKVFTVDGDGWGEVAAIELGPQDRLVVRDREAKLERLLPVVDAFLVDIDLETRVITVAPPDDFPADPLGEAS